MATPTWRAEAIVATDVVRAFRIFSEHTNAWWKRGPRFRTAGSARGTLNLEPFLHGRVFESFEYDGVTHVVRTGRVQVWEPPTRIVFDWRAPHCSADELSQVEVTFEASEHQARVTVTHRDWDALAPDHPARANLGDPDAFWRELLDGFRDHVATQTA